MQESTLSTLSSTATVAEQISREYGTVVARSEVSTPVAVVPLRPKTLRLYLYAMTMAHAGRPFRHACSTHSHSLGIPFVNTPTHPPPLYPPLKDFFST